MRNGISDKLYNAGANYVSRVNLRQDCDMLGNMLKKGTRINKRKHTLVKGSLQHFFVVLHSYDVGVPYFVHNRIAGSACCWGPDLLPRELCRCIRKLDGKRH